MLAPKRPLRSLMTAQPVTVRPDDDVDSLMQLLERYPFHHLPVVEGNRLLGIVSDRDVLLATGWLPKTDREHRSGFRSPRKVHEIMQAPVRTLRADASCGAAARLIVEQRIGSVPVVDDVGLVGIVTETDLLELLAESTSPTERVVDRMRSDVRTAAEEDDLLATVGRLLDSHIRHLPVARDGELVGVLSDRDVRLALARLSQEDARVETQGSRRVPSLRVTDVMTEAPYTVTRVTPVSRAVNGMIHHRIGALPVVAERRLVGILSRVDVLKALMDAGNAASEGAAAGEAALP